jgi:RNA polymerase sigma-70 factor (ECF subfamily)
LFINRLKDSDPDAEREFVAHFGTAIWIKLKSSIHSPEIIEDVRQETLLRVLRHLRSGKPIEHPERFPAFVHGVCKNVIREMQRSRGRHPQFSENFSHPVDPGIGQEAEIALLERKELVQEVLSQLPAKDRIALGLVYLDEVGRKEACKRLHIKEGYLRVVLCRARVHFRKVIELKQKQQKGVL